MVTGSPSTTPSLPALAKISADNALDPQILDFLQDKGVQSSGVFFHMFAQRDKIAKFLEPLTIGVTLGGVDVKKDVTQLAVAEATLENMMDELTILRSQQMAAASPATPVAPPAATSSSTTQAEAAKPPKSLPKGYWAQVVKDFEAEKVAGVNRVFPVNLLVGAEETLARMVHEKTVSGLYSPVKLGEVISVRHFTPSGQVNPWNRSETDRIEKLTFENGQFVRQPKATPEPQRLLTVIDAFESIKWAMIFARWGKEPDVVRFCEFFINMVRDNPNKIPQVREYYKKCSWDLAMHMRSEHTFESGVDRILQSPDKHDALARWLPPDGPGKGKGKKGQGKGRETHPYGGKGKWRTPSAPTTAPQGTPDNQCRLWAQGFCKFGDKCKFVHGPRPSLPVPAGPPPQR